jgi:hypothetical protein
MDQDDLYAMSRLEIFSSWKVERISCTGDGPKWVCEITTNDPTEVVTSRSHQSLGSAITSAIETVFYRERARGVA